MAQLSVSGQAVISASDLNRIKASLQVEDEATASKAARAADLHQKSQARAKTWDNTLEGSRRKKAEEKRKRLDADEEARRKIDVEEAAIQLEKRRQAIERANVLLHEGQDRMKSFRSKMMFTDVLAERDAQVKLKDELSALEDIREQRYLEMDKQNYRKMLERELREKEEKTRRNAEFAAAQKDQLEQSVNKRLGEIEEGILEGEMLARKAHEDLKEQQKLAMEQRRQAQQALVETQKANTYLKQIRQEDALRQQREEEKIKEYAEKKEKMLQLRRQKEADVFARKQAERQKMIDMQAKRLNEMRDDENARVEAQVLEKEHLDEEKRIQKQMQLKSMMEDIDQSRRHQIDRKRNQRDQNRTEEMEGAKMWKEWCHHLDATEQEEKQHKRMASRKLAQDQLRQAEMIRRKKEQEKRNEDTVAIKAKEAMETDALEFHRYAEHAIREAAQEGKNVIPLIKELREFRKRIAE
mmetsp:Transcript_25054/g.55115  ORF Transcript_25054/g.55115 Transcript_25054/m.55115 type:complete len:469 (+) Transcript_25054:95-1501(+)